MKNKIVESKNELLLINKKNIIKINEINCDNFEYSNKTITIFTGKIVPFGGELRTQETIFVNYPATILINE